MMNGTKGRNFACDYFSCTPKFVYIEYFSVSIIYIYIINYILLIFDNIYVGNVMIYIFWTSYFLRLVKSFGVNIDL